MLNVPNTLSFARILLVPALLWFAWSGHREAFLACLVFSILTDIVDGWIARRLNQATQLGAKLDSWSDLLTWLSVPLCAWWLRADVIRQEAVLLGTAVAFYAGAIVIGFVKYHRLTSYHTWGAKLMAILIAAATIVFFAGGPAWPLRLVVPVLILASLEEICITVLLSRWRANVPSLWHARKLETLDRSTTAPAALNPESD